jgi:hypothetical protein
VHHHALAGDLAHEAGGHLGFAAVLDADEEHGGVAASVIGSQLTTDGR